MNTPPRKRKATSASSINPDISPEDPALATIDVVAVEVPELTEDEQRDRLLLERKVERAFFESGKALAELRDRRLYRSTHRTFEEYCRDRFGHSRQKSNYLIAAAQVFENLRTIGCQNVTEENLGTIGCQNVTEEDLTTIGCQNVAEENLRTIGCQNVDEEDLRTIGCQNVDEEDLTTNGTQILPTSERQVRPLTQLDPQQQRKAWQDAVQQAKGKVPSGRIVKDAVQRIMERTKVPNTYQIGEVCQIMVKDNPELRGMGGCWAIVTYVGEFSCAVRTWNGELTVGVQHLKSCEYLPSECEQVGALCDRLARVYSTELEESVQKFLESLGKLNRVYLTQLEDKVLSLLEAEVRD